MIKRSTVFLIIILMVAGILIGCQPKKAEAPYEEIPTVNEAEEPGYRRTLLYFEDENGYIVPVMKKIKLEEGIGKAALSQMEESAAESLRSSGLYAILPDNAKYTLNVEKKVGTLNINKDSLTANNAIEENNRIIALVNTLTEFSTIEKVQFLIDGKKVSKLKFGTDVSKPIGRFDLNPESAEEDADLSSASKLMLYFEDKESAHIVPVTRYITGAVGVAEAVEQLLDGPKDAAFLENAFPEGTKLLENPKLDDKNTLTVNFSKEFKTLSEKPQTERAALKTLFLTCLEFDNVHNVNILVEGKEYEGSAAAMAMPLFPNSMQ